MASGGNVLNPVTGFYRPIAAETLTIPSTAAKVITVGAYDSRLNAYADFSGRGGSNLSFPKPDLVAPGVNITAPTPGGAYTTVTGTSFSTPFVTGLRRPPDGMGHHTTKRPIPLGRESQSLLKTRRAAPARI